MNEEQIQSGEVTLLQRKKALAKALELEFKEDHFDEGYRDKILECEEGEFLVLTDEEADEAVYEAIDGSVWTFSAYFIIAHSRVLSSDDASEAVIKAIQEQCENGNEAMKKLIDDFDYFVEDAVSADGRGHFLSSYDGDELEAWIDGQWFFVYRIN